MNMQRKIGAAVMALAAVAFGVDHWLLGSGGAGSSPSQASAATTIVASATGNARTTPKVQTKPAGPRTLAERLQAAADVERVQAEDVADAFRPSEKLLPPPPPPPAVAAQANAAPKVDPVQQFRTTHKVSAVMNAGRQNQGGMALVNGRTVLTGQQLDGFTLVSVNTQTRTATFTNGTVQAELKIDLK